MFYQTYDPCTLYECLNALPQTFAVATTPSRQYINGKEGAHIN